MMNRTGIEYLDYSWNPIAMRCIPVSSGCSNCWHLKLADRFKHNPNFSERVQGAYGDESEPVLVESRLDDPVGRTKPSLIGVQFMGDLFNRMVPFEMIERVHSIIQDCPQHVFVLLTKRPKRARWFYSDRGDFDNVILGTTAEDQRYLSKRLSELVRIENVRGTWLSLEPMLSLYWNLDYQLSDDGQLMLRSENTGRVLEVAVGGSIYPAENVETKAWRPDWVVVGGESGKDARPMSESAVRQVRDFCIEEKVPFFFKQWGRYIPMSQMEDSSDVDERVDVDWTVSDHVDKFVPLGKSNTGRTFDGRVYTEMPDWVLEDLEREEWIVDK